MKYFLRKTQFLLRKKCSYLRCEQYTVSFKHLYNFANFTNSNKSLYTDIFESIYFEKIDFFF